MEIFQLWASLNNPKEYLIELELVEQHKTIVI